MNTTPLPVGLYSLLVFTNDTQGNILSASFSMTVQDTTGPNWVIEPEDRVLTFGQALDYQLDALDLSGTTIWTLNDTIHFTISSSGRILSVGVLTPGKYGLTVTVSDIYGNQLSADFSVTVQSSTTTTTETTTTTTNGPTTPDDSDTLMVVVVSSLGGAVISLVIIGLLFRKKLFS